MLSVCAKHPSARISPRDGHRAESYVGKRRERVFSWSAACPERCRGAGLFILFTPSFERSLEGLPLLRCREGHRQVISQGQAAVPLDDRKIRVKFLLLAFLFRKDGGQINLIPSGIVPSHLSGNPTNQELTAKTQLNRGTASRRKNCLNKLSFRFAPLAISRFSMEIDCALNERS